MALNNKDKDESVRLNKYISNCGICSRREADKLIEEGKVTVNDEKASLGTQVTSDDIVKINGEVIKPVTEKIFLAFNKPDGIICTSEIREDETNIFQYLNYPERIFYAGRLDKNSQGLLLLTNQGDMANDIMKASNEHEKEYEVTVNKKLTNTFLNSMAAGVPILETITKPCKIRKTGDKSSNIILTQGLNRQIRRMCEYFGYEVTNLRRIRIMNVELGDLQVGEYRPLSKEEIEGIYKSINKEYKE